MLEYECVGLMFFLSGHVIAIISLSYFPYGKHADNMNLSKIYK